MASLLPAPPPTAATPAPVPASAADRRTETEPRPSGWAPVLSQPHVWLSLVAWAYLFQLARYEWVEGGGMRYGWIVLLVAPLIWRRNQPNALGRLPGPAQVAAWLALGLAVALFVPARWLLEANPEWRLPLWSLAAGAVMLTLGAHLLAGGWPLLRPAVLVSLVLLAAMPWPVSVETPIRIDGAQWVSSAAAEILSACGVPAISRGNVLDLARGSVGVDEACSGLHGTQNAFLAAVTLAALFALRGRRLVLLFLAAAGLAVGANLLRVMVLAVAHNAGGPAAFHAWHDSVGLVASALPLAGLFYFASRWATPPSAQRPLPQTATSPALWTALALLLAACAMLEAGIERWYAAPAPVSAERAPEIAWPRQAAGFTALPLSEDVVSMLRCQSHAAGRWSGADSTRWVAYSLHWDAGRGAMQLARAHQPKNCFSMRGVRLAETGEPLSLRVGGHVLHFERFTFVPLEGTPGPEAGPIHVFFARRSAGQDDAGSAADPWSWDERVRLAREGRRPSEQQVFEFALRGPRDLQSASEIFQANAEALFAAEPAR